MRPSEAYAGQTKELDADSRAVVLREIQEDISMLAFLGDAVKANSPVALDLAANVLYLKESRLATLAELFGLELDSVKAREARYAELRAANTKIRDLKKELGASGSPKQTSSHLSLLGDKLNLWWDVYGFGHISELTFTRYGGAQAQFSCMLFGRRPLISRRRPVSDKAQTEQWLAGLAVRGFELYQEPGERDLSLKDSDTNRRLLAELFKAHFPAALITATTNHYDRSGVATLKDVHVFFPGLEELDALPSEEPDEPAAD